MTDGSETNIHDSVIMGSVLNLSQIHNLIITTNPKELPSEVEKMLANYNGNEPTTTEIKITLKSQVEAYKQKQNEEILNKNLTKLMLNEGQNELNDNYLQRVIAQDLLQLYWTLHGNLMLKKGGDQSWYSDHHLEDDLLDEAIISARNLCISALKMNDEPFGVLCRVRSMSTLSIISALGGDIDLAEKYGIESINIWEKYGENYFSKCGYPINGGPVMGENKLDLFYEIQVVYGAYHGILILEQPGENRIRKLFNHLDAHPISIFTWSADSSCPMWTTISDLPEFSKLSKYEIKKHYQYWINQAKVQGCDDDLELLEEIIVGLD